MSVSRFTGLLAAIVAIAGSASAHAGFTDYVIRNSSVGNVAPTIQANNTYVPGATEFIITQGGQKAGWGSNDINGSTIGQIANVSVTRHDTTAYTPGSGPAVAPYLNIWVTNGAGKYAVLANEPSDPIFQPLLESNMDGSRSYNLSFADLANKPVKVYETLNGGNASTTTWVHDLFGNVPLTFGDVASLQIAAPNAAYITGPNSVGTGAPRELGTNVAYGVNWIFGDTLSNYTTGSEGYIVSNASVTAIPEPATFALAGAAAIGVFAAGRRRRQA